MSTRFLKILQICWMYHAKKTLENLKSFVTVFNLSKIIHHILWYRGWREKFTFMDKSKAMGKMERDDCHGLGRKATL